jgi:hypothetical protein
MFEIWHRTRKHAEKVKAGAAAGGRLLWVRKTLPDAGAQQYAFETYGTPVYDFALGNGATFVRHPLVETQPALWANYTSPVLPNPPSNVFQGQFATQPLMDPNTAVALGITVQDAIPPDAYNSIPPEGPAIALNG